MTKPGIYIHIDPITYQIRYIGKSTNWPKRSREHLKPNRLQKEDSHHHRWLQQLLKQNLQPIIQCLQEFPNNISLNELNQAEIYWISYFKSIGSPLTNSTIGGEGHPISDETKQKISIKLRQPNAIRSPITGRIRKQPILTHSDLIKAQPNSKPIVDNYNNEYSSIKEASRALNIKFQKISDILRGLKRSHKGYTFRYK
jgi:hypothetical protein